MPQTKKQSNGRGRPTKGFNLVKSEKLHDGSNQTASRGRPKKIRKIDDSINTKIDNQKKSISQLEKTNKEIEKQLGDYNISYRTTKGSSIDMDNFVYDDNRRADNTSLIVLICAMMFFIFALGKTFLYKTTMAEIRIHELMNSQNMVNVGNNEGDGYENMDEINEEEIINNEEGIINNEEEIINNEEVIINNEEELVNNEEELVNNEEVIINNESNVAMDLQSNDQTLIYNFYNYINELDYDHINASVDKYLRNSDVFRTYFTQNWLSRFKNKVNNNGLNISNINLKSGDENSTRYYDYTVHYELAESGESFDEEWELAIVNRNGEYLIGSIRCVTTGCSKMPFFQK